MLLNSCEQLRQLRAAVTVVRRLQHFKLSHHSGGFYHIVKIKENSASSGAGNLDVSDGGDPKEDYRPPNCGPELMGHLFLNCGL